MLDSTWLETYPALASLDQEASELFASSAAAVSVPRGHVIFSPGDPCDHWFMGLKGSVRVVQNTSSGREIVVCRLFPGKTCIVTAIGIMARDPHTTRAIADTDVTAIALSAPAFRDLIMRSEGFREFVFSAYNTEILGLMSTIEDVTCGRIDSRLATVLLEHRSDDEVFYGTHEDLAAELGTAREVVTRQLKTFEQRGWVRTQRGSVALSNPSALRMISTHSLS